MINTKDNFDEKRKLSCFDDLRRWLEELGENEAKKRTQLLWQRFFPEGQQEEVEYLKEHNTFTVFRHIYSLSSE